MQLKDFEKKVFIAIIVIAVLAKIVSLFLLPHEAYNDALFHIFVSNQIIESQSFSLSGMGVPPPFYYSILASFFLLSGISLNLFSAKIFGLVLVFLQLALGFLVLKRIFPTNFLPPLAFFVVFPWVTRFTSTAYPESVSIVLVLAATFLTILLAEKKIFSFFELLPLSFVISALSLSKLNGTILVFAFLLAVVFLLWKKSVPKKTIIGFGVLTLFLSGFWFGLNFLNFGVFDQHIGTDVYNVGEETGFSFTSIFSNLPFYYLYFFDFPNASAFFEGSFLFGLGFFELAVVFFLLTLPLFFVLIFGAKKVAEKKNYFSLLVLFAILLAFIPVIQRTAYYRLIVPAVPFFAILFGFGYSALKNNFRTIALVSLIGFSVFSVAYTSISAYQFNSTQKLNEPLYEQINKLPEDSVILIEANRVRDIEFVLEKKAFGVSTFTPEFLTENESDFFQALKEKSITQVAIVCSKDPFDKNVIEGMVEQNYFKLVFENECSKLFEVQ